MNDLVKILGFEYLPGRRMNYGFFLLLAVRDLLLRPFLSAAPRAAPNLQEVGTICVCKLDHLGDLLMIVPLLRRLRLLAPEAKVTLVVADWCAQLAGILQEQGVVDDVVHCNLASLDRSGRPLLEKIRLGLVTRWRAVMILRRKKIDLFFDLRPFSPNAWSLGWLAGAGFRIGFGLRGMAYTYHRLMAYDFASPFGQLFLDGLGNLCGEKVLYEGPELPDMREIASLPAYEKMPRNYLVVQMFSLEAAKNVPTAYWLEAIKLLTGSYDVLLVGSKKDVEQVDAEIIRVKRVTSLIGKTSVIELLRVVEESAGVVSVDSFVAHIGLAYHKPVVVLTAQEMSERRAYPAGTRNLLFLASESAYPEQVRDFFGAFKNDF